MRFWKRLLEKQLHQITAIRLADGEDEKRWENLWMDKAQKKALTEEWKNRRPEMGVISLRCKETGEAFLGTAKDTKAAFNSVRAKLSGGIHPNKRLMELWKRYGEEGFELSVAAVLEYEDPLEDHTEELETLRDLCLAENPQAVKIWK